jgi:uncharacterized membrane-anchored protein YhcB (DUF1043 family)
MSKSKRRKQNKAQLEAYKAQLRKTATFCDNGRVLQPGTREYEKALQHLIDSTSPEELIPLLSKEADNAEGS